MGSSIDSGRIAHSNRARSVRLARRSWYRGLGSRSRRARCLRQPWRRAFASAIEKLNLHQAGREFEPKALRPTPGAIDLCLVTDVPLDEVAAHLRAESVVIEHGPVDKIGARGPLRSLYFRDPDGNLIEVSNEVGD